MGRETVLRNQVGSEMLAMVDNGCCQVVMVTKVSWVWVEEIERLSFGNRKEGWTRNSCEPEKRREC